MKRDPVKRAWTDAWDAVDAADARVAVLEAQLARIRDRVDVLVDAGWLSLEAATELRNVYDNDEEARR